MSAEPTEDEITRFADMFSAMGTGPRLRIMRVLLSAHPDGMVVNEIGAGVKHSGLNALASSGKVEKRRSGQVPSRGDISLVLGEHRSAAGSFRVPLCGVLYPQQSNQAKSNHARLYLRRGIYGT